MTFVNGPQEQMFQASTGSVIYTLQHCPETHGEMVTLSLNRFLKKTAAVKHGYSGMNHNDATYPDSLSAALRRSSWVALSTGTALRSHPGCTALWWVTFSLISQPARRGSNTEGQTLVIAFKRQKMCESVA